MTELKGQARRGVEQRAAIVDAAIGVFAERGFQGGALAEVADRVGLSAASILYHFGSKDALLLVALEEVDRRWTAELMDEVFGVEGLEAIRRLPRIAEVVRAAPRFSALQFHLEAEHLDTPSEPLDYLRKRARAGRVLIARALHRGKELGEIGEHVDPETTAMEVAAFLSGAIREWLVNPRLPIVDMVQGYVTRLEGWLVGPRR